MISAWDSFHFAILELVRSAPIKQRLVSAYRRHLASVTQDQLPGEVRDAFEQVLRYLNGVRPLPSEDAVTASVRKMSNLEADECASLIVEIFGLMCRSYADHLSRPSAEVVQLRGVDRDSTELVSRA
jgi:hypothetical protein